MRRSVLLWLLLILLAILVFGMMFGGYRKGSKINAPDPGSRPAILVLADAGGPSRAAW
ncbi:hypothetical protein [Solihabitans fulvus]|uniref:hypothetical protein n=1 Tax=Solihabitans fulvus TaxID=1892852 RepID=UPI0016620162|nr:hypothetical protein [Solihabitans fulvus]